MKIAKLRVMIVMDDNETWIEKIKDADGTAITCGGGDLDKFFDEVWLDIALHNLGEAILNG